VRRRASVSVREEDEQRLEKRRRFGVNSYLRFDPWRFERFVIKPLVKF
jgi:hypothetical protein